MNLRIKKKENELQDKEKRGYDLVYFLIGSLS